MDLKELARELKTVFDEKGYTWKIDGVSTVPSEHDILETMEQMVKHIADEPSGTWLELGRLIYIKTDDKIDVYVLHATIITDE